MNQLGQDTDKRCPCCRKGRWRESVATASATIWQCLGCGLGQTVPRPREADGRESFTENRDYFERAYEEPKDHWWHRFMDAPLVLLEAAGARPGMRLLDLGSNLGYLVAKARQRGFEASGVDGSSAAVAVGRERLGVDLLCSRIETAPIKPASQDIIVLNHVLEHVPEPAGLLKFAARWLKQGGLLLLALPNFASPIARMAGQQWAGLVPSQHMWHFTPGALSRLVTNAGLQPLRWTTRMLTYRPQGLFGWVKWSARWVLEHTGGADNLMLIARAQGKQDRP